MNGKAVLGPNQRCGTSVIWLFVGCQEIMCICSSERVAMFNCMMSVQCKHVQ